VERAARDASASASVFDIQVGDGLPMQQKVLECCLAKDVENINAPDTN
jgi:hypothetical protein